jgi:hypothetical protein
MIQIKLKKLHVRNIGAIIIIDNEWSFKSGKIVVRDAAADNRLTFYNI